MSKQLTGIRENLHYHENSTEANLNAGLPRLTDGLLIVMLVGISSTLWRGARETSDVLWRLSNYDTITCGCGAKLRMPPAFRESRMKCPHCGRTHQV